MSSSTNAPGARHAAADRRWPWLGSLCALHGLLLVALLYAPRTWPVGPGVLPAGRGAFEVFSWLYWPWLGWFITGAWRVGAGVVAARIALSIGLAGWLGATPFMLFYTLVALGAHT